MDSIIPDDDPHSSQLDDPLQIHQQHPNEDFLDQILSNCTWPSNPNPDDDPGLKPSPGHVDRPTTAPPGAFHYPFNDPFGNGSGFGNNPGSIHSNNPFHHPPPPPLPSQTFGGAKGGATTVPASASTGGSSGGATPQKQSKARARRGQATDPHSIAERLRRERIAERMKALQELVPNANKTDKASMLDEIIEYVKFLQLQVKVVSMSRLGGVAAMAPMMGDISSQGGGARRMMNEVNQTAMTPNDNNNNNKIAITENQVAKLMEEDMGSAMQYLQGKGLCLMPISLATAISSAACTSRNPPPPPSRSQSNPCLNIDSDNNNITPLPNVLDRSTTSG